MKRVILVLIIISNTAFAGTLSSLYVSTLADKIYLVEGGSHTHYPYGVKIKGRTFTTAEARVICEKTIRNHYDRWERGGEKGDFITSLANRYCPKECDAVGNTRWKRNIKRLMK